MDRSGSLRAGTSTSRVLNADGGARFVEVAVMAAVPYDHRVPMLVCGPYATAFADAMRPFSVFILWRRPIRSGVERL